MDCGCDIKSGGFIDKLRNDQILRTDFAELGYLKSIANHNSNQNSNQNYISLIS